MPRAKPKRHVPVLDMTPMVDLAFLLVTFFMLTTQFRPEEVVTVDLPASTSVKPEPSTHLLTITVSDQGKVFLDMAGQHDRVAWIARMNDEYKLGIPEQSQKLFGNLSSFGLPMSQMKQYLAGDQDTRKNFKSGIPMDTSNLRGELYNWVLNARIATNNGIRIAIKGDGKANYNQFRQVVKTVQEAKVSRFVLITDAKAAPAGL